MYAGENTITIDFKGEDESTTLTFTIQYSDPSFSDHEYQFDLTFTLAAYCEKYAILS